MSKVRAGIDIGSRFLHISEWSDGKLTAVYAETLPEGLVKDGRIVSATAMGDFLKEQRKAHKIAAKEASLVLHERECFCRRVDMPLMSDQQLKVNLPYEFRDFVSEDKDKYYYDYAVLRRTDPAPREPEEADGAEDAGAGAGGSLDLMAAAVPKETIAQYREVLKRGGFDLRVAIPEEMAYAALLSGSGAQGRQCILDLGHTSVRIHMFDGGTYQSGRSLDYGCGLMDDIVSGAMSVDPFIAATYRESNYQNCQELPGCMDLYNTIGLEVMKAVNFYNFSSQGQPLERVICCGGGAAIEPLLKTLRDTLPLPVEGCGDLLAGYVPSGEGGDAAEETRVSLAATGAATQRG